MTTVSAFTGGRNIPSARFRVRQYIETLENHGVFIDELYSPLGKYPPKTRLLRPLWGGATLSFDCINALKSHRSDKTLLQKEIVSTFLTVEPFTKRPRILDVDDAIWLNRNGLFKKKYQHLVSLCDLVICGNNFIEEYTQEYTRNTVVLPTGVDTARFCPLLQSESDIVTIVWSGTSSGFRYLYQIESALQTVVTKFPNVLLRIVSDSAPQFTTIQSNRVEYIPWTEQIEASSIQSADIGIMPLLDSDYERGKCSFKMLLYMSCGLPVVCSPVGMNGELFQLGTIGFPAETLTDWVDGLSVLVQDRMLARQNGIVGREIVVRDFCVSVVGKRLANILRG